jgi:hypothetical protein
VHKVGPDDHISKLIIDQPYYLCFVCNPYVCSVDLNCSVIPTVILAPKEQGHLRHYEYWVPQSSACTLQSGPLVSKQSPFCSLGACDGGGGSQGLKAPTIHEC